MIPYRKQTKTGLKVSTWIDATKFQEFENNGEEFNTNIVERSYENLSGS
jgi:hypothetical protein